MGKSFPWSGEFRRGNTLCILGTLARDERWLSSRSADAAAPGEASSFLLLASSAAVERLKLESLLSLYRPGFGDKPGHLYSQEPYLGEGLDKAVKQSLQYSNGSNIHTIYSSMNGESFWSKELGVSMTRNNEGFTESVLTEHPADCYGDIGAASSLAMLNSMSMGKPGYSLCTASSDHSYRAAMVVRK
ncbi:MAG: hypothetical protein COB33_010625 [Thiotrichaceae bacterium]|nr:hypothetical protein [Thiotrichaceae bacterium]